MADQNYQEAANQPGAQTTATTEAPQVTAPTTRWQRFRIKMYVLKLRIFWWIAKRNGIMLLGIDGYSTAVKDIASLTSYCERSGLLARDTNARDQIRSHLGQLVNHLQFAEAIAAPERFRQTLGVYVQMRHATMSKGAKERLGMLKFVMHQNVADKLSRSKLRAMMRSQERERFRRVAS